MNSKQIIVILLLISVTLLTACTPTEVPTQVATPSPEVASDTPTPASTSIPTIPPSATLTLTPTQTVLPPTETSIPTPLPDITNRTPSAEEIQAYLVSNGFVGFSQIAKVLFADVNGDGEEDAIAITDQTPVFILLWQGERFAAPVETGEWREGVNNADGRFVYLKDYTADHLPEIVNDSWYSEAGDNYTVYNWRRQITKCEQDTCRVIWNDWISSYGDAPTSTGMFYYNSSDFAYGDEQGRIILERLYFGLSVYWSYIGVEPVLKEEYTPSALGWDTAESQFIDVDLSRRYVWNGTEFEFLEDEVLEGPKLVEADTQLEAFGPREVRAHIRLELDQTSETYRNDRCQLYLDGQPISDPFGCKNDFTKVVWEDITGDREKELLVWTASGDQSYIWNDLFAEKGCFHQRLIVYTWDGETATQVGNFVGCVRRSDLFGVTIRDYDEDGQLEILAAALWPEFLAPEQPDGFSQDYLRFSQLIEIYEWDGTKFILGSTLGN
ncbi:MAG TPA: hypothetical protein VI451_18475 [Anaerolineales bacterium]|nr:hypothetical protein [Anaerolineales bacterium]